MRFDISAVDSGPPRLHVDVYCSRNVRRAHDALVGPDGKQHADVFQWPLTFYDDLPKLEDYGYEARNAEDGIFYEVEGVVTMSRRDHCLSVCTTLLAAGQDSCIKRGSYRCCSTKWDTLTPS